MVTFTALTLKIALLSSSPFAMCQNPEEEGDYFEGDMVDFIVPPIISGSRRRAGEISLRKRWKSKTIPYEFAPNYPRDLQDRFFKATQHIASRTCITFVSRITEADYVYVKFDDEACSSYVGRKGGRQSMSLARKCKLGTVIHEIIHAIGFQHEQSRTDRDDFVKINVTNIKNGKEGNFYKYGTNQVSSFGVNYDYGSIMHYSKYAFSKNKLATIEPTQRNVEIGQRVGMSAGDIVKIKNMYNC